MANSSLIGEEMKSRQYWIYHLDGRSDVYDSEQKEFERPADLHVIEYSAYESVVKERDQYCKQSENYSLELAKMLVALEWYADVANWIQSEIDASDASLENDPYDRSGGERARKALADYKQESK